MAVDAGVGFVDILPRTDKFTGVLLTKVSGALNSISSRVGGQATAIGRTLAGGMALPIVAGLAAAGVAVTKLASDYEDSIVRLRTLVGLSAEETHSLSEAVLELATTLPQSPQELADALFFVTSAGFRGAEAMDILETSAKAAASGLGETKVVADAVTSAMNSYAKSGLTAAQATDVLIKAVAEGKFEAAELAPVIGGVLPIAAQLGVEFNEVAAAIAAATRQGLSVNRAATGVRFLLSSFIKPSGAAEEALGRVGLSVEKLQTRLAKKGLLDTLQLLAEKFDLSTAAGKRAFAQIVGGARGLSVAAIQVGENAEAVQVLTDNIADAAGTTADAWAVASQTLTNRIGTLKSTFLSMAISIGTVLIPVVSTLVSALTGLATTVLVPLARSFKGLLLIFIGYKVLASWLPALLFRIALGLEAIGSVALAGKVLTLAVALTELAGPLALIVGATFALAKITEARQQKALERISGTIVKFGSDSEKSAKAVVGLHKAIAQEHGVGFRLPTTTEQRAAIQKDFDETISALDRQHRATEVLQTDIAEISREAQRGAAEVGGNFRFIAQAVGQSTAEFTGRLRGALSASQTDVRAWGKFVGETMVKAADFFRDWRAEAADNLTGVSGVLSQFANKNKVDLDKVLTAFERTADRARQFTRDLLVIGKTGGQSGKDLANALLAMGPAGQGLAASIAGAGDQMRDKLVGSFGDILSAGENGAGRLQRVLVGTLEEIRDILTSIAKRFGITVESNAPEVSSDIEALRNQLFQLDGTVVDVGIRGHTKVEVPGGDSGGPLPIASGAILAGARGFVTRGPTILAGESKKPTRFGTGAEIVQPLDDRGIGIMAKAFRLAIDQAGGMGQAGDIHVTLEMDGERMGRAIVKRNTRRASLMGAAS